MAGARSILRGEVETFGLPTLLTVMEMERRTGMLVLQRGRQIGRLYVRDGRVLRARLESRHRRLGADAVFELLSWTEGHFELWQAPIEGPDEIGASISFLLVESARRRDEADAATNAAAEVDAEMTATGDAAF